MLLFRKDDADPLHIVLFTPGAIRHVMFEASFLYLLLPHGQWAVFGYYLARY